MAELRARALTVAYGPRTVIRDVELTVRAGEAVAVVGPNGAGKTTLVRCLAGVVAPRSGAVTLDGRDLSALSRNAVARRIAVVPQVTETMFPFTLREIVALGRTARLGRFGTARPDDDAAIERALAQMDLLPLSHARIDRVSGGERQRAVVAMALAQETDVLLLDEPTTHLDPSHQRATLAHVRDLAVRGGMLVLAVLHDLNLAAAFASRIVVIHRGRVLKDGPPRDVLDGPTVRDVFGPGLEVIRHAERVLVVPDRLV
ncbi:MAG: ABC transporter ATP-binding protein [Chloroflexi bacterium]|nr:ABC transporter ATP-binding protein [Chloroflexota bacterium]